MATFDLARLYAEDYPARVGDVLAALGSVESERWLEVAQCVRVGEPALVRIGEGHWALELWHTDDLGLSPNAQPIADEYAKRWGKSVPTALLYLGDLTSAYCDLVTDGILEMGAPVNVCCSTRHPLFVAAVIAQNQGLPIYTVVGEDEDGRLKRYKQSGRLPEGWQDLVPYVEQCGANKVFADVLTAKCEREDAEEVAQTLVDDEGYLLHPMSARAYYLSNLYREEAESRNPILTVAPFHPYSAPKTMCEWVCERTPKDYRQALSLLELETGWEIPEQLKDREKAETIIITIKNHYGETL